MSKNDAFFIAGQVGVVPLAEGEPGVAKTETLKALGRATGRPVFIIIGSIREPADIGGYPWLVDGVMKIAPTAWVAEANKQPSIIGYDEITTCPPAAQAAMLRPIAEKVVGETELRADTWQFALCNPSGVAANGQEIEPPLANRLCHLKWHVDWDLWKQGLLRGLQFDDPQFPVVPDNWRDTIPAVAGLVTAFHRHKPALFQAYPQNDRSKASGPWPSMRSWTNGVLCLAGAKSVGADDDVRAELLSGCVGDGAALEYFTWEKNLDLPDPVEVLKWSRAVLDGKPINWPGTKEKAYVHPDRPDKAIAMLSSVASQVMSKDTIDQREWEAAVHVCEMCADKQIDVSVSCVRPLLMPKVMPKGAQLSTTFMAKVYPTMKKVWFDNQ